MGIFNGSLNRKLWLAIGAAMLIALCLLFLLPWTRDLPSPRTEDNSIASIDPEPAAEQKIGLVASVAAEREVVSGLGSLIVHVTYADGRPASRVGVGVRRGTQLSPVERWETADFYGRTRFDGLPAGSVCVEIDRRVAGEDCFVEIKAGEQSQLSLTIRHCGEVAGRVVDVAGQPIVGARIVLAAMMTEGHVPSVVCRTDHDGRFEFRTGLRPSLVGAQADGYSSSSFVMVGFDGRQGERQSADFVLEQGLLVAGTVRDENGAAVGNCCVEVGSQASGAPLAPVLSPSVPVRLRTDEHGRFSTREARRGRALLTAAKEGFATSIDEIDVGAPASELLTITLAAEARLRGTVRDASGKPLVGIRIRAAVADGRWRHVTATTGAGEYAIRGAPLGELQIAAHYESEQLERKQVKLTRGGDAVCDFVRAPGRTITGRVVDQEGRPLPGAVVRIKLDASWRQSGIAACGEDGRFAFKEMGGHSAELTAERDGFYTATVANIVGARQLDDVVLAPLPRSDAIVRARIVKADGNPASYSLVKLEGPLDTTASANCDGDGWLTVGPVIAGEARLRIAHVGSPVRQTKLELFSGANDVGTIRLHAGGSIRIDSSRPADSVRGHLESAAGEHVADLVVVEGALVSGLLEPGAYRAHLSGEGVAAAIESVNVVNGQQTRLRWDLGDPVVVDVRVCGGRKYTGGGYHLVHVRGEAGAVAVLGFAWEDDANKQLRVWLAPGRYTASISTLTGEVVAEFFAGTGEKVEVSLELGR